MRPNSTNGNVKYQHLALNILISSVWSTVLVVSVEVKGESVCDVVITAVILTKFPSKIIHKHVRNCGVGTLFSLGVCTNTWVFCAFYLESEFISK